MTVQEIDKEIDALLRAFERTQERVSAVAEKTSRDADLSRLAGLIDQRVDELVAAREEILRRIEGLPDSQQRRVLILRYGAGLKWSEIAAEMHFSIRHVHRLYNQACVEIGYYTEGG